MKELIKYKEKLFNLKFPNSQIENDELAEFYSELVEIDLYYAGIIQSLIDKKLKNEINFKYLKEVSNIFNNINYEKLSESDKQIYNNCKEYLQVLEELPNLIKARNVVRDENE